MQTSLPLASWLYGTPRRSHLALAPLCRRFQHLDPRFLQRHRGDAHGERCACSTTTYRLGGERRLFGEAGVLARHVWPNDRIELVSYRCEREPNGSWSQFDTRSPPEQCSLLL